MKIKLDHACKALGTVFGMEQMTSECLLLLLSFLWTSHYINVTFPTQLPVPSLCQNNHEALDQVTQVASNGGFVLDTQPDSFQHQVHGPRGRLVPSG